MVQPIEWIKQNKLAAILAIAVIYLVGQNLFTPVFNQRLNNPKSLSLGYPEIGSDMAIGSQNSYSMGVSRRMPINPVPEAAPTTQTDRMVIQDTYLSMVVKDVSETIQSLRSLAINFGGFMVNSQVSQPQGAGSGSITLRVPTEKLEAALIDIRATGVKVVSENVTGHDVTDAYVDMESRLANLNATKAKYESILADAKTVPQILEVQRELDNLQTQIDNLKGQQLYLAQSAKLTKITISLSTDEMALPYTPDDAWRPAVIVKEATRSLIGNLRSVGSLIIWIGIYAPIWLTVIAGIFLIKRLTKNKRP